MEHLRAVMVSQFLTVADVTDSNILSVGGRFSQVDTASKHVTNRRIVKKNYDCSLVCNSCGC